MVSARVPEALGADFQAHLIGEGELRWLAWCGTGREVRSLLLGYYFASLAFSELPRRVHNAEQALVSLSLASPLGRCEAQKPSEQQATHVPYVLSPLPRVCWLVGSSKDNTGCQILFYSESPAPSVRSNLIYFFSLEHLPSRT